MSCIIKLLLGKLHLHKFDIKTTLKQCPLAFILFDFQHWESPGGRLNKKDGLTRYGDSHAKDKTS